MNYILTQEELDELKADVVKAAKSSATVEQVLKTFSEYMVVRTVCLDVNLGQETVMYPKDFQNAIKKTREHYAKKNPIL